MKNLFIKIFTATLFFQNLLLSSFIVSDKNTQEERKELAEKQLHSLYNKINSLDNQIQWLTTTVLQQEKLITELKESKSVNEAITIIEDEILTIIRNKKLNESKEKQLELITQQVKLQSQLLELLGYKKEEQVEKVIPKYNSNTPDRLIFLKTTTVKHTQDIERLKQESNAPVCKVVTLEKEIEILRKEILDPSKQDISSQIDLLDEQAKLQARLLTLLNFYK